LARREGQWLDRSRLRRVAFFIRHLREETAYPAGWLYDRLANRFGGGQVFKDVDSIQLGDDFVEVTTRAVGSCDVLLALIGDQWLTISDKIHETCRRSSSMLVLGREPKEATRTFTCSANLTQVKDASDDAGPRPSSETSSLGT
jgi:hypothetical protein